ncbi:ribosome modulation factor [Sphingopyxis terrae]|uniref:ribosome modulation factor n=1 Tax=Sphingopyxis terrae TaxID=33052 RepID=UPI0007873F09|nr:hypothetical protein [Sphingopyxis terrae]
MTARKKAPAKKPAKKAAPREHKTPERSAAEQSAYEQGRKARMSGISDRESPHRKGSLRDHWLDGWNAETGF